MKIQQRQHFLPSRKRLNKGLNFRSLSVLLGSLWLCSGCQILEDKIPSSSVSVSPTPPVTLSDPATVSLIEKAIFEQINQYRQSRNLPPLEFNEKVAQYARINSEKMAIATQLSLSPEEVKDTFQQLKGWVSYNKSAQNLAMNREKNNPAAKAVETWLKNENQRQNIESNFNVTGVGVAHNNLGEYYITQIFLQQPPPKRVPSPSPILSPTVSQSSYQTAFLNALEQETNNQVNQHRLGQKLPPLRLDERISKVAREFSQKMADGKAPFSHDGFKQRAAIVNKSIPYWTFGENLAVNLGYADPVRVAVQGWIQSPGHRKNMEGDFDLTGIGVAKNAKGEYYFTQLFVKKR